MFGGFAAPQIPVAGQPPVPEPGWLCASFVFLNEAHGGEGKLQLAWEEPEERNALPTRTSVRFISYGKVAPWGGYWMCIAEPTPGLRMVFDHAGRKEKLLWHEKFVTVWPPLPADPDYGFWDFNGQDYRKRAVKVKLVSTIVLSRESLADPTAAFAGLMHVAGTTAGLLQAQQERRQERYRTHVVGTAGTAGTAGHTVHVAVGEIVHTAGAAGAAGKERAVADGSSEAQSSTEAGAAGSSEQIMVGTLRPRDLRRPVDEEQLVDPPREEF